MKSVMKYLSNPATLAKFWMVLSTTLVGAVATGLIVGTPASWIVLIVGAVSSAGVFAVRNAKLPEEK